MPLYKKAFVNVQSRSILGCGWSNSLIQLQASSRFAVRFVANKHPVNLSTTENNKDVTTTIGATMTTGTVSARPEDEESLDNVASMCRRNR